MVSRRKLNSFYRIIRSDNTNATGVRIPNQFAKQHRKKILLHKVHLVLPDDKVWAVEWTISGDGKLWLKKGWPEFAEHYCLRLGHLLLFNHLGKSVFQVTIFDQSNCEIDYLTPSKSPKSKKKRILSVIQDNQALAMAETEHVNVPSGFQTIKVNSDLKIKKLRRWKNCKDSRNRALEAANSFQSHNPFYFVPITTSYLRSWLYMPSQFLKTYLSKGEKCVDGFLRSSDGTNWGPVNCTDCGQYGRLHGANWKKFRDDNRLGVGDVCVLELIDNVERVFKVTIFYGC